MIESKGWNWKIVKDDGELIWKNPSIESYYLLNRWMSQNKKEFLDLGCGFGRNGFNVNCFDISEEAIKRTKAWAESEDLKFEYKVGDMLELPYKDEQFDCIYCRNVISHTDTEGMEQITSELYRVLKENGECYLTLGSKDTWGFKQDWPMVDENTKLKMEEGPEYKTPHFFADYDLIKKLFKDFKYDSYHYHVLIQKV